MKISFNWLKQYINVDLSAAEVAQYLTDCGLEIEGIETYETIRGGLRGLVIGEVLTCERHSDSDHLHLTTVNVGQETPLSIVCGAPNVAEGQKVVVATMGTVLYKGEDTFTIKKTKIRGAISEGMICAEDEIGIGTSHDGIMVLPDEVEVGTPAADYFNVETDSIFEIGLTPNRSDAISHIGVARDLYAVLKTKGIKCSGLVIPTAPNLIVSACKNNIEIVVENKEACPRYAGITFEQVKVTESPIWLQNRLKSIGVRPINIIVDITQYVMFETGQPLHAFDADKISGRKVIVKNLPSDTPFVTLDGNEIKLDEEDLMICNTEKGMCIAGVYGGLDSGITEHSTSLFLESAYFNPVSVRKTSKRHDLKTDASFRFERGCDPENTVYALKRAANLIKELTGAIVTSEVMDEYPVRMERPTITLRYEEVNAIAGEEIDKNVISSILLLLGMEIQTMGDDQLMVQVPLFKHDVTRPIDLIEEILRIYGYNNISIPQELSYKMGSLQLAKDVLIQQKISTYLADNGFYEIMNNSLTKSSYIQHFNFIDAEQSVAILNPLSIELNVLRQSLLLSGLESIAHNQSYKNSNLRLFEFGKTYHRISSNKNKKVTEQYEEKDILAIFVTGKLNEEVWNHSTTELDFFYLKNIVYNILKKNNFSVDELELYTNDSEVFHEHLHFGIDNKKVISLGRVHTKVSTFFDIKKPVFYAEVNLELFYEYAQKDPIYYSKIALFPPVKRDLALVIDKAISYQQLEEIAHRVAKKWLQSVTLFDVYEGEHIPKDKKSYALNFVLQHPDKTLTDNEIQKVMNRLIDAYKQEVGAQLR